MAYDPREPVVLGYANGFSLWHYRSDDALSEVTAAGYFAAAGKMLRSGDFLFANLGQGAHALLVMVPAGAEGLGVVALVALGRPPVAVEAAA